LLAWDALPDLADYIGTMGGVFHPGGKEGFVKIGDSLYG